MHALLGWFWVVPFAWWARLAWKQRGRRIDAEQRCTEWESEFWRLVAFCGQVPGVGVVINGRAPRDGRVPHLTFDGYRSRVSVDREGDLGPLEDL